MKPKNFQEIINHFGRIQKELDPEIENESSLKRSLRMESILETKDLKMKYILEAETEGIRDFYKERETLLEFLYSKNYLSFKPVQRSMENVRSLYATENLRKFKQFY